MSIFVDVIDDVMDDANASNEKAGSHQNKPSLMLLHGWGLNGAAWDNVRQLLAPHYKLLIVDLPGHGYSRDEPLTTLDAAADAIANAMPHPMHLLGWSLGGQIALTVAYRHAALVDKLVLVSTTPRFVVADDWPYGKKAAVLDDFAKRLETHYAATIRGFLALQTMHQPNARSTIAELQTAMSARGEPSALSLQAGLNILRTSDVRELLATVPHASLVIQGDHDALTSEAAAHWLAGHLPNANYALMPHAAHAPFLSHRELFLEHVTKHLRR